MTFESHDWPSVNRLKFLDRATGRQFCVSGGEHEVSNCMASFLGSALTKLPRLREWVRTIDRCDRLPERPSFKPALILLWKHTLKPVRVLDVIASPGRPRV
jgi:hypothetical protein